jgi:hypothetical protein
VTPPTGAEGVKEAISDGWPHARLIPTAGIRNELERERRASSCLLAVMHGVPEFAHSLLKELGAPKSSVIETYAEVRFKDAAGKVVIPDGAIVCRRAGKSWTCLVEVKTGTNDLKDDQVATYLDLARDHGFDGVLTISNQITATSSESPVGVDGRKLRRTALWHFSWWRILTEAVVQNQYRGVSNPDQAWILRELIHYLSSEASGAAGFEDMGEHWVDVRKCAREGTLRQGDAATRAVAERWEQFIQYLCLSFSQDLGRTVISPRVPRNQTTASRLDEITKALAGSGELTATLHVPDAVGDLHIKADLRARQIATSVKVDAPADRRPKARTTWLLRQLDGGPDDLHIDAAYPNARDTMHATLGVAREDPNRLLYAPDPKRETRSFTITYIHPMGQKRGRDEGSFVRDTSSQVVAFYRDLVQNLKPWVPPAPRIRQAESGNEDNDTEITPPWAEDASVDGSGTSAGAADVDPI